MSLSPKNRASRRQFVSPTRPLSRPAKLAVEHLDDRIVPAGAHILSATFSGTAANTYDTVRLAFSEAINPLTFDATDITLTRPNGKTLATNVALVAGTTDQFDVTFKAQSVVGTYSITTGVDILNLTGDQMDQNENGTPGESGIAPAGDQFLASKALTDPTDTSGASITTAVFSGAAANTFDKVTLTFSEAVQPTSFDNTDITLTGPGGAITGANVAEVAGSGGTVFDVTFASQSAAGIYTIQTGVDILDFGGVAGNQMNQNGNGTNGEPGIDPVGDEFEASDGILDPTDMSGASITGAVFSGAVLNTLDKVTLTFSEAIQPSSFDGTDITLTGPGGAITGANVAEVAGSGGTVFDVTFASQSVAGTYTIQTGVDILDFGGVAGNQMNQNGNGTNGEPGLDPAGDEFQATDTLNAGDTTGASITNAAFSGTTANTFDKVTLDFSEAIDPASFDKTDVTLTGPNGAITATNVVEVVGSGGKQFDVTFASQSAAGPYTITTGVDILDLAGNQMNQNGIAPNGEPGLAPTGDEFQASDDLFDPTDMSGASITNAVFSTAGGPFDKVTLTFSEAIQAGTFDKTDITLTGPGGAITVTGVAEVAGSGGTVFDVTFASQSVAGTYTIQTGVDILDFGGVAGNQMNQNGNGTNGEPGLDPAGDEFQATDTITTTIPDTTGASITNAVFSTAGGPFDKVTLTFSEAMDPTNFDNTDISLTGPGGLISPTTVTEVVGSGGTVFDVTFASQSAAGAYTLTTGVNILDLAGNPMDQNTNGNNGEAGFPPVGDQFQVSDTITGTTPDTTGANITGAVFAGATPNTFDKVTLTFSEAMDPTNFTTADVSLLGPNGPISATDVIEVTGSGGTQFDVTFGSQSTEGTYTITTGVNILDLAGNLMNQNGTAPNGEAGLPPAGDQFSVSDTLTATATTGIIALGQSDGSVKILDAATGAVIGSPFRPFDAAGKTYKSLVTVALGDVDGDGIADLFVGATKRAGIAGLDASKAGKVFVYSGADLAQGIADPANPLDTFTPFATPFGGVTNPDGTTAYQTGFELTTGDIDGDGVLDLVASSRGDVGQVSVQSTAPGHAPIGAIVTPYGTNYRGKVSVTAGNFIDEATVAQRNDEIATARGNTDNVTGDPLAQGTSTRAALFDLVGTTLTQITFSGAISPTGVPFGIAGTGGEIIDRNAFVEAVDTDGNGVAELLFAARDFVSDSSNPQIRVAVYGIAASGAATSLGSYLAGDHVGSYSIDHHRNGTGTDDLVMVVDGPSQGILLLDPLSGTPVTTLPTAITVLTGGNRVAST